MKSSNFDHSKGKLLSSNITKKSLTEKKKKIIIIKSVRTLTLSRATPAQLELTKLWLNETRAYLKSCIAVNPSGLLYCTKRPIYN